MSACFGGTCLSKCIEHTVLLQVLVSYPKETHWWTRKRPPYELPGKMLPYNQWLQNHATKIEKAHRRNVPDYIVIEGSASLFWEHPTVGSGILTPELLHAVDPTPRYVQSTKCYVRSRSLLFNVPITNALSSLVTLYSAHMHL